MYSLKGEDTLVELLPSSRPGKEPCAASRSKVETIKGKPAAKFWKEVDAKKP